MVGVHKVGGDDYTLCCPCDCRWRQVTLPHDAVVELGHPHDVREEGWMVDFRHNTGLMTVDTWTSILIHPRETIFLLYRPSMGMEGLLLRLYAVME